MNIQFEGHKGKLNIENMNVNFYGMVFTTIIEAVNMLKSIPSGPFYRPWYYRGHRGFLSEDDGSVYLKDRWLTDEEFAKEFIKIGYK